MVMGVMGQVLRLAAPLNSTVTMCHSVLFPYHVPFPFPFLRLFLFSFNFSFSVSFSFPVRFLASFLFLSSFSFPFRLSFFCSSSFCFSILFLFHFFFLVLFLFPFPSRVPLSLPLYLNKAVGMSLKSPMHRYSHQHVDTYTQMLWLCAVVVFLRLCAVVVCLPLCLAVVCCAPAVWRLRLGSGGAHCDLALSFFRGPCRFTSKQRMGLP